MLRNAKLITKGASPQHYLKEDKKRGEPGFFASSSMLRKFLACPSKWKEGEEDKETKSKIFGSLFDCLLLVPDQFDERYAIKPLHYPDKVTGDPKEWSANSTWCKQWIASHTSFDIVSNEDMDQSNLAIKRLLSNETLKSFLANSDRQVWLVAEWVDEKTGLVIPIKVMLDVVPRLDTEFAGSLGDLKSTVSAALTPFNRQIFKFGWHIQAALYEDVYKLATGEDRNTYCLFGVENKPPFEPFRRIISQDFMQIGRQTYQHALAMYARCLKTGFWPSYDDHKDAIQGWTLCVPEPWMEFVALEDALEQEQDRQLVETDDVPP